MWALVQCLVSLQKERDLGTDGQEEFHVSEGRGWRFVDITQNCQGLLVTTIKREETWTRLLDSLNLTKGCLSLGLQD